MDEKPGILSAIISDMLTIMLCGSIPAIQNTFTSEVTVVFTKHLTKAKITFSNQTCLFLNSTG